MIVFFCYDHAITPSRFFKFRLLSILSSLVCLSPPSVIYSISSIPRSAGRIPDHLSPGNGILLLGHDAHLSEELCTVYLFHPECPARKLLDLRSDDICAFDLLMSWPPPSILLFLSPLPNLPSIFSFRRFLPSISSASQLTISAHIAFLIAHL